MKFINVCVIAGLVSMGAVGCASASGDEVDSTEQHVIAPPPADGWVRSDLPITATGFSVTTAIGSLEKGDATPLRVRVPARGSLAEEVQDIQLAAPLAGHEDFILQKAAGHVVWALGKKNMVGTRQGTSALGTPIELPVWGPIQVETLAFESDKNASGIGVLKKPAPEDGLPKFGVYELEIKVGEGNDADDAGSFVADFRNSRADATPLIGKPAKLEGTMLSRIENVLVRNNTYLMTSDYMAVRDAYKKAQ
jgi:hypothetical protein